MLPDESSINDNIYETNVAVNCPFEQKIGIEMDNTRFDSNLFLTNKMIVADRITLSSPDSQEIYGFFF